MRVRNRQRCCTLRPSCAAAAQPHGHGRRGGVGTGRTRHREAAAPTSARVSAGGLCMCWCPASSLTIQEVGPCPQSPVLPPLSRHTPGFLPALSSVLGNGPDSRGHPLLLWSIAGWEPREVTIGTTSRSPQTSLRKETGKGRARPSKLEARRKPSSSQSPDPITCIRPQGTPPNTHSPGLPREPSN